MPAQHVSGNNTKAINPSRLKLGYDDRRVFGPQLIKFENLPLDLVIPNVVSAPLLRPWLCLSFSLSLFLSFFLSLSLFLSFFLSSFFFFLLLFVRAYV